MVKWMLSFSGSHCKNMLSCCKDSPDKDLPEALELMNWQITQFSGRPLISYQGGKCFHVAAQCQWSTVYWSSVSIVGLCLPLKYPVCLAPSFTAVVPMLQPFNTVLHVVTPNHQILFVTASWLSVCCHCESLCKYLIFRVSGMGPLWNRHSTLSLWVVSTTAVGADQAPCVRCFWSIENTEELRHTPCPHRVCHQPRKIKP